MKLLINIARAVEKMIIGERGVVEKVESIADNQIYIQGDCFGNLPNIVTFRTPLGRRVTKLSETVPVVGSNFHDDYNFPHFMYRQYKRGDKYP